MCNQSDGPPRLMSRMHLHRGDSNDPIGMWLIAEAAPHGSTFCALAQRPNHVQGHDFSRRIGRREQVPSWILNRAPRSCPLLIFLQNMERTQSAGPTVDPRQVSETDRRGDSNDPIGAWLNAAAAPQNITFCALAPRRDHVHGHDFSRRIGRREQVPRRYQVGS